MDGHRSLDHVAAFLGGGCESGSGEPICSRVAELTYNQLLQFVPGLAALHRMPFSLRYKGTAEQRRYVVTTWLLLNFINGVSRHSYQHEILR